MSRTYRAVLDWSGKRHDVQKRVGEGATSEDLEARKRGKIQILITTKRTDNPLYKRTLV